MSSAECTREMLIIPRFPDINECNPSGLAPNHQHYHHTCHSDANCTNTDGSFYCTCHTGYAGDGVTCSGNEAKHLIIT